VNLCGHLFVEYFPSRVNVWKIGQNCIYALKWSMVFNEPIVTTLMMAQQHFLVHGHPKRYEMSNIRSEIRLRPYIDYSCHWDYFYEIHACSTTFLKTSMPNKFSSKRFESLILGHRLMGNWTSGWMDVVPTCGGFYLLKKPEISIHTVRRDRIFYGCTCACLIRKRRQSVRLLSRYY